VVTDATAALSSQTCLQPIQSPLASLRLRVFASSLSFHPYPLFISRLVTPVTQINPSSQPRPGKPSNSTVEQTNGWDEDELLHWIQQKKPKLLERRGNLEKFEAANFLGESFLRHTGDTDYIMKATGLPYLVSEDLGDEVKKGKFIL
jgi:hypothetical protein